VTSELPAVLASNLPELDLSRSSIMGHSMGGHGAITIGLKNPSKYKSISAFSPICNPINVPWGKKVFGGYLGEDEATWKVSV
jgi:S-formylglutathione hydrolase